MTLKNNRAPLLSNIKLYASFHHHMWIQTGVTVRKWLSWVITSVTLTFDLWPWPFAWTSLLSLVITPENFVMIQWREHSQKGVTDRQTDRRTDWTIHRAAWSQLKMKMKLSELVSSFRCNKFEDYICKNGTLNTNKANLRDLIAATSLVILLKFDPNHRFFSLCDLEIWWMTAKIIGHLFYTTLSFVHHFKSICEFKLKLQSGNGQFGSKLVIFCPVWPWNLMNDLGNQ